MTKEQKEIIHLDMDAFYPAVEVLDNPELRGKPVIVGGSRGRGVVSSASYEARAYGLHSAQPIAVAERLCPHGIYLPVRMKRYQECSKQVFEIFRRFTPFVEPLSIDEAFLDVSGSRKLFGSAENIVKQIKSSVFDEIGLTVSAGIAPSKLVAKIASNLNKPDGLTIVPHGKVNEFLDPLPIQKLWGVGKATQKVLTFLGVVTIGDLRLLSLDLLERKFGRHGNHLYRMARGWDRREVETGREVKSIGHELTFTEDIPDMEAATREILSLSTEVARRMRQNGLTGKTITLKVKYHDFVQITRSFTMARPTQDHGSIFRTCRLLLKGTEVGSRPVRLLGVSLSQLSSLNDEHQISLFPDEDNSGKKQSLNLALDTITDKYGRKAIRPALLLKK